MEAPGLEGLERSLGWAAPAEHPQGVGTFLCGAISFRTNLLISHSFAWDCVQQSPHGFYTNSQTFRWRLGSQGYAGWPSAGWDVAHSGACVQWSMHSYPYIPVEGRKVRPIQALSQLMSTAGWQVTPTDFLSSPGLLGEKPVIKTQGGPGCRAPGWLLL